MANEIKHSTPKYRLDRLTVALWNKGIDPIWNEETKMWALIDKRVPVDTFERKTDTIDEVMIERSCSECLISNKNWDKDDLEERVSNYKQIKPSDVLSLIDSGINPNQIYRIELPGIDRPVDDCHTECVKDFPIGCLKQDIIYCHDRDDVIYILINDEEEK